ncbi:MAG: SRPBCC family protein [Gammaproteobacteria bacterium]|jgi:coenzyme Q-binding protein COQ10
MHHFDSKSLPYTCTQLFALVADIERYPAFLPGWSSVRILHSDKSRMQVEQQLRLGLLQLQFESTAELEHCNRILITSSDPPFHKMTIDWRFNSLRENHCEISVEMTLLLQPGPLKYPLEKILGHSSSQLLWLFENRARSLYSRA